MLPPPCCLLICSASHWLSRFFPFRIGCTVFNMRTCFGLFSSQTKNGNWKASEIPAWQCHLCVAAEPWSVWLLKVEAVELLFHLQLVHGQYFYSSVSSVWTIIKSDTFPAVRATVRWVSWGKHCATVCAVFVCVPYCPVRINLLPVFSLWNHLWNPKNAGVCMQTEWVYTVQGCLMKL